MATEPDLQRPQPAAAVGIRRSPAPGPDAEGGGPGPVFRAGDRGGPATWIEAAPGMARSGAGVSMADRRTARALGWFSLGLGIPQVLIPGKINRLAGIENTVGRRQVTRLAGLREIGSGIGIFGSQPKPAEWLWARTAGDLLDLTLLQVALRNPANRRRRILLTAAAVAGITALDLAQARRHSRALKQSGEGKALKCRTSITVNRPVEEVYRFWRQFQNLPRFMFHLESVRELGDGRSHWVARAPLGRTVEWDAEVVEDVPNQMIAWRATEGADVPNSGSVRFLPAPGGRGTEVLVEIDYRLPGGAMGDTVAKLFGEDPQQQVKDDLRRFKQVVETGEVMLSDGRPDGTLSIGQLKMRPAQPLP